jgi:hypothetical protein
MASSRSQIANEDDVKAVLQKYRDEPLDQLYFSPSIELLMDADHCRTINQIVHQSGTQWERLKAVPTLWSQLPNISGIYMFVWTPDVALRFASAPEVERFFWVLYIGKAGEPEAPNATIRSRYKSEYTKYVGRDPSCLWDGSSPDTRESRLTKYLTLRPLEFWYLSIDQVSEIVLLEKRLLKLLKPPLNYQHGPKLRLGKPMPAF